MLAVKQRLACDRCSHHKLRCNKRTDSDTCLRCQAANVECVFSPSRRGCRPSKTKSQERNHAASDTVVTDSNLFPPSLIAPWESSLLSSQLDPHFFDTSLTTSTRSASADLQTQTSLSESSPTLLLNQNLAKLYHKLSEHLIKIPSDSIWSFTPGQPPEDLGFQPDETFAVTQSLIDMYRDTAAVQASGALDDATIYMLIACHHRVLSIWDRMLEHARNCIIFSSHTAPVGVPPVRFGSFKTSPSTSVNLYGTLIVHLAQQLQNGILSLITKLSQDSTTSTELDTSFDELARFEDVSSSPNATLLSCQAVVDRAAKMLMGIQAIKASIPDSVLQN